MSTLKLPTKRVGINPISSYHPDAFRSSGPVRPARTVRAPDWRPSFGLGFSRDPLPVVTHIGLTLPQALDAYRFAWRSLNGQTWFWTMTWDGCPIANDPDDLLEQLDEVNVGDRPFAELRLGAA
jgi:hypothetical protein